MRFAFPQVNGGYLNTNLSTNPSKSIQSTRSKYKQPQSILTAKVGEKINKIPFKYTWRNKNPKLAKPATQPQLKVMRGHTWTQDGVHRVLAPAVHRQ